MPENPNTDASIQETGLPVLQMTVSAGQTVQAPVDKTLSISEMPADAKATGDAINNLGSLLEQEISDLTTDVVLKSMVDNTLSVTGYAADAKATGDAIYAVLANLLVNNKHVVANVLNLYGTDIKVTDDSEAQTIAEAIQDIQNDGADVIMYDSDNSVTLKDALESELSTAEIDTIFESVFGGDE